jgi:hypothetical protein
MTKEELKNKILVLRAQTDAQKKEADKYIALAQEISARRLEDLEELQSLLEEYKSLN